MMKECWDALNSMGANKSPGNDGLSKKFYICFFKEMHMYLIQALNHSFQMSSCLTLRDKL